jgi:hypothetical protein
VVHKWRGHGDIEVYGVCASRHVGIGIVRIISEELKLVGGRWRGYQGGGNCVKRHNVFELGGWRTLLTCLTVSVETRQQR